ncbi:hypothetical protein HK104_005497, partial [Borealophlyctis nickersoniae]
MHVDNSNVFLEYSTLLTELKTLEARATSYNNLAQQVNSEETACLKELARQRKKVKEVLEKTKNVAQKDQSLGDLAVALQRKLQHVEYQMPQPAHIILRLALGNCAPFSLRPSQLRLEYKREYEVFKMRMTLISCALAAINLFLVDSRVLDAVFGFLLLYYYCTCVLREHILMVNGSRIRRWWSTHHYVSIITSGIILVWPATPSYAAFRGPFYSFAMFIAFIQALQYRYQKARLYVLVALDRARPMDTVAGEGFFSDQLEREFLVLAPFLVAGQLWQLYIAWMLSDIYKNQTSKEWQVLAAACLFGFLGAGNMLTTARTYMAKKKPSKEKLRYFPNSPASPPAPPSPRLLSTPVQPLTPTTTAAHRLDNTGD